MWIFLYLGLLLPWPSVKQVDDIIDWYFDQTCSNIIIVGDFNLTEIDWTNNSLKSNRDSHMHNAFLDLIMCNNLVQKVTKPTHNKGNILELIATNLSTSNLNIESSCSDYFLIDFNIIADNVIKRTKSLTKPKPFWQFNKADLAHIIFDCLKLDKQISNHISDHKDPEIIWHSFKSGLLSIAHNHTPCKFKKQKSQLWKPVKPSVN